MIDEYIKNIHFVFGTRRDDGLFPFLKDPAFFTMYFYFISVAEARDQKSKPWSWYRPLKRGEYLTSVPRLMKLTGLKEKAVKYRLKKGKDLGYWSTESRGSAGTCICVHDWRKIHLDDDEY